MPFFCGEQNNKTTMKKTLPGYKLQITCNSMHNFDQEMYHEHHKNSVFVALSHYIQFQIAYNTLLSGST